MRIWSGPVFPRLRMNPTRSSCFSWCFHSASVLGCSTTVKRTVQVFCILQWPQTKLSKPSSYSAPVDTSC